MASAFTSVSGLNTEDEQVNNGEQVDQIRPMLPVACLAGRLLSAVRLRTTVNKIQQVDQGRQSYLLPRILP